MKEIYTVNINDIDFNSLNRDVNKQEIEEYIYNDFVYVKGIINGLTKYYTIQYIPEDKSYKMICNNITAFEYEKALNDSNQKITKRISYSFIDDGEKFVLNMYLVNNEWLIILEREVLNNNRKELPKYIKKAIAIDHKKIIKK